LDFSNSTTIIVSDDQRVIAETSSATVEIVYGELPIRHSRSLPVVRRPSLYSLIGQDTLEPYTFKQFGLPPATKFGVGAVDPGPQPDAWAAIRDAALKAIAAGLTKGLQVRLIVFPSNLVNVPDSHEIQTLRDLAVSNSVDLVVEFGGVTPPISMMIASDFGPQHSVLTHAGTGSPLSQRSCACAAVRKMGSPAASAMIEQLMRCAFSSTIRGIRWPTIAIGLSITPALATRAPGCGARAFGSAVVKRLLIAFVTALVMLEFAKVWLRETAKLGRIPF
jgi:hypothetical protein